MEGASPDENGSQAGGTETHGGLGREASPQDRSGRDPQPTRESTPGQLAYTRRCRHLNRLLGTTIWKYTSLPKAAQLRRASAHQNQNGQELPKGFMIMQVNSNVEETWRTTDL